MQELLRDGRVHLVETHMCRFGMSSHLKEKDGDRGWVKKPTGFMTSSRCVADQLERRCDGRHDHVHLVGGRAAAAQVYPPALCQAMIKGIVMQKKVDAGRQISTPKMDTGQFKQFIRSITCHNSSTIRVIGKTIVPIGQWASNWVDPVHEEDGGDDRFGAKPQEGINILKAELDALSFKNGIATARDDVSGTSSSPTWSRRPGLRR